MSIPASACFWNFSKRLHKNVRKEPAKFVTVEPAVNNLRVEIPGDVYDEGKLLTVRGEFDLGKDYTVTVAGESAAQEPFTLGQASPQGGELFARAFAPLFSGICHAPAALGHEAI